MHRFHDKKNIRAFPRDANRVADVPDYVPISHKKILVIIRNTLLLEFIPTFHDIDKMQFCSDNTL